ncbi:MAG: acyltransferase [Saprospiraceae bacterium]
MAFQLFPTDNPKQSIRNVRVGENVRIFDFVNAYDCQIGGGTKVGTFVEIQAEVTIGENCKISTHSFLCSGVQIGNEVFVGHNVTFINDKYPAATNLDGSLQTAADWEQLSTIVEDRVSIGSGAVIMGGIRIGEGAQIGAGAVVTKNVAAGTLVVGVPARVVR